MEKKVFETKVVEVFLKMQPSETKVFKDFPKVGTFVPNDGSPTMVRPRLALTTVVAPPAVVPP